MRKHCTLALLAAAAISSGACELVSGSEPAGPAARIAAVSGDRQTAPAGTEVPQTLVVKVTDANGRPVVDQQVRWLLAAGAGTVHAGTSTENWSGLTTTDRNGHARARWILGPFAGDTQWVEADAIDPATGRAIVFTTLRAVATPGAPTGMRAFRSEVLWGRPGEPAADSLAAVVMDRFGNSVPGIAVSFATGGGGSVSPVTVTTGADGVARTVWTLGPDAGVRQTASATVTAIGSLPFTAHVVTGETALGVASGDGQVASAGTSLPRPLMVRFTTAGGSPIPGATVRWSVGSGGAAMPAASTTDGNGVARTSWRLGPAPGVHAASATVAGTGNAVGFTAAAQP